MLRWCVREVAALTSLGAEMSADVALIKTLQIHNYSGLFGLALERR